MESKVFLALTLCSIVAMALWGTMRRQLNPVTVARDRSGGAKVQRQRIDHVIEKTRKLDIQRAIDSLSQYNENYELAQFASLSPSSLGLCYMKQVVSDRRVSKIFEHFLSLPADKASVEASRMFDNQFSLFEKEWRRLAVDQSFDNTGVVRHAASSALLLCSYFCSPDTLDQKFKRWDDMLKSDFILEFRRKTRLINDDIDPTFRLNLLVISGSRNGSSIENLNRQLATLSTKLTGDTVPLIQVESVNLFKWDAETLDTDFTHVTRGVPASGNSILLELPGFTDPNMFLFMQDKEWFSAVEHTINTWRRNRDSN